MISIEQLDQFGTLRATSGWDWMGLLSLNSLTIRSPQSGAKKLPGIKVSDKLLSERLKIDCWRKRAPGVETAELCTK